MRITLADISKQIGVSTATISRVINNEKNVTQETKKTVEEALKACNYQYRPRSKTAETRNTDAILIIAGQITNPITISYIDGIREVLTPLSKKIFISISDYSGQAEMNYLQYAKDNGFAGVFMLNVIENDKLIKLLQSMSAPVILVNRYLRSMDVDVVTIDNYRCGYMATQYLIEHGHKRIAHIAGPQNSITCQNRTLGYMDAMESAGIPVTKDSIYYGDRTYNSGFEIGTRIAKLPADKRCTGFFSTSGLMADGFIDALTNNGIKVPDDISVICNDDSSRESRGKAKVTCVEPDQHKMGVAAAELFLDKLKTPNSSPKRITYPPILSEHGSVKTIAPEEPATN
ncbi:MAG: LacI family DNA-binding transcriptional regulator [Sphaerochaetaceae bacterium]|nr:LacI family DNA-binding transcriptional regulator [Sphaerochaetaceae bacterium]MDD3162983.1 LacI family DNA-binding transcriptional regulator [Sphaerochaetaceae bacterium]MDD4006403.1 LacI family DNA-binding transcriptional regulator [Sphaerochaetaceae bacterium]MDD4397159.1 LacI family DNA-binding transcriptional regulator [Sphaerochaetaceae bacterium]